MQSPVEVPHLQIEQPRGVSEHGAEAAASAAIDAKLVSATGSCKTGKQQKV